MIDIINKLKRMRNYLILFMSAYQKNLANFHNIPFWILLRYLPFYKGSHFLYKAVRIISITISNSVNYMNMYYDTIRYTFLLFWGIPRLTSDKNKLSDSVLG